ncbi:MAG: formylglycine-generating enzyme family protein [Paludibacteraceae bacterium]|nr:formylglycine-generating enzyme family protein [Paludibacteraceae bacterium]
MKKLLTLCLLAVTMCVVAQNKKTVAVLEPLDRQKAVPAYMLASIRMTMETAITLSDEYEAFDRSALDRLKQEQHFQQSGEVDDTEKIKHLGALAGVNYVVVPEVAGGDGYVMISAKVMDVEKGRYDHAFDSEFVEMKPQEIQKAARKLAVDMFGLSGGPTSSSSSSLSPRSGSHADFTETAWDINMKMVWVEGGDFLMGCTSEQSDCGDDEKNVRRVTVDGYWIGMCEVTQSQWEKVIGTSIYQQKSKANGSNTCGVGADYPMYYVSWDEAMEFCRLLSNKTGKTYTLPTEAQWEYAARGGNKADGSKYAGSNMIDVVGWYTDNSGSGTHPVATKRPNGLGLYDMSGNVWEWCKDWYSSGYAGYDTNNPTGASLGRFRVERGGSWYYNASCCCVSNRSIGNPSDRDDDLGFRVVLIP